MAPRRKFGLDTLDEVLERDGAKTDFDRDLPVVSQTIIKFECACGEEHEKRLDVALSYGMFCKVCMAKKVVERQKESASVSKQNILDVAQQHLLVFDDGFEKIVPANEVVTLVVAPEFLTKSVRRTTSYGFKYVTANFWDQQMEATRNKKFRIIDGDVETQRAAAGLFLESIPDISESYTITRQMKDLAAKPSWCERHLRIAPAIIQYPDVPVPIDPYLLSSWLGDGSANKVELTNIEPEIIKYWNDYAASNSFKLTHSAGSINYNLTDPTSGKRNRMMTAFRNLGILKTKSIPRMYIENSETVRLAVIAGLIDTDGSLHGTNTGRSSVSYEFSQCVAHEAIFDGFREIIHSLGWRMSKRRCVKHCTDKHGVKKAFEAFRGIVVGDKRLQDIPVLVPRKKIERTTLARRDLYRFKIQNAPDSSI